jgi:hypothetical protein
MEARMTSMADRNPHGDAVTRERARCVLDACELCRGASGSGYPRRPERLEYKLGSWWRHMHVPAPGTISCRASLIYERHIAEGRAVEQILPPVGVAE